MDALNCEMRARGDRDYGGREEVGVPLIGNLLLLLLLGVVPPCLEKESRAHRTAWNGHMKPASPRWGEPRAHALNASTW